MALYTATLTYTDDAEKIAQVRPTHREYLKTLLDSGKLHESGPFTDDSGALIIYEDHGKEPSHRISRFVMARNDLAVWYVGRDFQTERITAVDQLEGKK